VKTGKDDERKGSGKKSRKKEKKGEDSD